MTGFVFRCGAAGALALLTGASLTAQVPERPLPKPNAELAESFSSVTSIRELPEGRVLVVDAKERTVFLADLARNTVAKVGREGAGPLEYRASGFLVARGDSTWLLDFILRRFLVLDRAGTPVRSQTLSADPAAAFRVMGIRGIDPQGRWVSEVMPMQFDPGAMRAGGNAFVVRWTADSARADTLARLAAPTIEPRISGTPSAGMRIGVPIIPPADRDMWDLFPDGTVAVVRAADYHVEYIRPDGKKMAGPPIPHPRVAMTEADRERIRSQARAQYEQAMKAAVAAGGGAAKLAIDVEEPKAWPKYFPPFESVRSSGDGRLWIAPPARGPEHPVVWDVITPTGMLAMRVRFPPRTRLVGFGRNALYTVRTDEDDLQYLQRHPFP